MKMIASTKLNQAQRAMQNAKAYGIANKGSPNLTLATYNTFLIYIYRDYQPRNA